MANQNDRKNAMKFDASILVDDPGLAGAMAADLEASGFDGVYPFEGQHDPFLPLAVAAQQTRELSLITGIAVAFARSPLTLAHLAYDLQLTSKGRFILGLGSQVKAHIERRYNMPWSKPAARMRDMVNAIHAIWDSWEKGTPLSYQGEFYQHSLMMPTFNPGPNPFGKPPIFLAGIGPLMTEVAGEVGDGLMVHPFHTPEFMHAVTLPALEKGWRNAGKERQNFQISCQVIIATGHTDEEIQRATEAARGQIAFYASTPTYLPVLEVAGCADIQPELTHLSKQGRWQDMAPLVSEELLHRVAVVGSPAEVARGLVESRGNLVNRISPVAYASDTRLFKAVISEIDALTMAT